jgi:lysylphosphatidylglycerol synthetase-like protein (DUF2156 family)
LKDIILQFVGFVMWLYNFSQYPELKSKFSEQLTWVISAGASIFIRSLLYLVIMLVGLIIGILIADSLSKNKTNQASN